MVETVRDNVGHYHPVIGASGQNDIRVRFEDGQIIATIEGNKQYLWMRDVGVSFYKQPSETKLDIT